jgi:uncharacterized lipoprotein YajG
MLTLQDGSILPAHGIGAHSGEEREMTMRKVLTRVAVLLLAAAAMPLQPLHAQTVQGTPRQVVVIVAEGLNPQVVNFGTMYTKTAFEGATVAFDDLKATAAAQPAGSVSMTALKGILKTAAANGYRTGLVTTGDVTTVAPMLYDLPNSNEITRTLISEAKFVAVFRLMLP